ncbi:tubulin binding cofactor A-domain-containing protein [Fimicolochytrium jonesii]|uniref:tubulin binding cofactor A-domain-containing protein n=1 Tax=Fimicolochytrium jonesii TaxID=1396493 RepID=UPI0022FE34B6|nr:tubulin binding cofactor A-domain-containing protein [Fimicolochytrium jonesii]KAI8820204.1 tubulin binding cofactor A-domain-containing protein [Fimicolochytrium jonesii]
MQATTMLSNTKPPAELLKKIKVQTGVVRRISKDLSYYDEEAITQQKRIDKLIADGADEHDIRKQKEVLEETHVMMPDGKKRLARAQEELQELLDKYLGAVDHEAATSEEVLAAKSLLQTLQTIIV